MKSLPAMRLRSPFLLLTLILLLGFLLRVAYADRLPISMNNDEIDFIVQAKSVFYTFTDLDRTWNPLSLQPLAKEAKSEILYLVLAPVFGFLPISLLTVRLPYIVINLGIILLLYFLARRFFSSGYALGVALIAAINPWMLFLSRTAFESHVAVCFYLLGVVTLLYAKGKQSVLSLLFFLIGFYSYMGTKVIFLPVILGTCFLAWRLNKKKYTQEYVIVSVLAFIFFGFFTATLINGSSHKRVNEFSFGSDKITDAVNSERKSSIQYPMQHVFTNKIGIGLREDIKRYFGAFSFDMLYAEGDPHSLYGFWDHGLFYYTDILFLLAGFLLLYRKQRIFFYYLVGLLLIGAVPSALSNVDTSYVHRSSWMLLLLVFVTGLGFVEIIKLLRKYSIFPFILAAVGMVMLYSLINFYHIYLLRNPIYNPIQGSYENRIIARFAHDEMTRGRRVVIVADNPQALLKSYLFYTNGIQASTIRTIQASFSLETPKYQSLGFAINCPKELDPRYTYIVFAIKCAAEYPKQEYSMIPILKDGSAIYRIYNDRLCSPYRLEGFPHNFTLENFTVESISTQRFCQTFITKR